MSLINIDSIINGTSEKAILHQYKVMKEDYNDTSAKVFYDTYKSQPLSTIVEMSRYIFSEPMYGYDFYKESVVNTDYCQFIALEGEREKIESYLDENKDKIPDTQKDMYETLLEEVNTLLESTKHTCVISESLESLDKGLNAKISDAIYSNDTDAFIEAFDNDDVLYSIVIEAYVPYIAKNGNNFFAQTVSSKFMDKMCHVTEEDSEFKPFVAAIVTGNKVKLDTGYQTALESVDRNLRMTIDYLSESNLAQIIEDSVTVTETPVYHVDALSAINNMYIDMKEDVGFQSLYAEERAHKEKLLNIVNEMCIIVLEHDYGDTFTSAAYTILNDDDASTYEDAMIHLSENSDFFVEAENATTPDDSPQDITIPSGKINKTDKPDIATRIQNKAMDAEAKQHKILGKVKQGAVKVRNAVKAVTALPMNIVNSIKDIAAKLDAADDEKRKKYITEPGFRKKIYRNMKLSLMYTSVLSHKLTLLPMLLVARHASKTKNRRIRNECYHELLTEIKICDEKINDAQARGDNAEKYRLMRIKDQLEAESVRVRLNSKYI